MTAFFEVSAIATERPPGTVGFFLDGGHTITDDDGMSVGGTYNQGTSTTLAWRGRKFRVSHLDLLRSLIAKIAPEDLDDFNESLTKEGT